MFKDELVEIGKRAIWHRGADYYKAEDAIEIITVCEKYGKEIYGIDAMDYDDPYIGVAEDIDFSIGFRSGWDPDEFKEKYFKNAHRDSGYWSEAIQFVKDRETTDWLYQVTYDGRTSIYESLRIQRLDNIN